MFSHLAKGDGWEKLQRHCQLHLAGEELRKAALSDADRKFLLELLSQYSYFSNAGMERQAKIMTEATAFATFEEAAKFALRQLGIVSPDFELRNERIRELLMSRSEAAIYATRSYVSGALDTIVNTFYDLGRHPFDQATLDSLRKTLGYQTDWQAKRFALTETGIAAEMAQAETYRRNGVKYKRWNILDQNTRPSHLELSAVTVGMDDQFNCGGYAADHPCDPKLPAEELVNCHCWLTPVMEDDFEIDPANIWEGQ
jgi:hypothetical protein